MAPKSAQHCIHLDQQIRWFGFRQEHGRKLYLFQCLGCGKVFSSRMPLTLKGVTGPLATLTGLSRI